MAKSIKAIFNWGMLTIFISFAAGYFINELSRIHAFYVIIVLIIYFVTSISYIREKIEMIKVENEINFLIESKGYYKGQEDYEARKRRMEHKMKRM